MPRKRLTYELQPDACPLNPLPNEGRSHHTVDPVLRTWMASKEIQDSSGIQDGTSEPGQNKERIQRDLTNLQPRGHCLNQQPNSSVELRA